MSLQVNTFDRLVTRRTFPMMNQSDLDDSGTGEDMLGKDMSLEVVGDCFNCSTNLSTVIKALRAELDEKLELAKGEYSDCAERVKLVMDSLKRKLIQQYQCNDALKAIIAQCSGYRDQLVAIKLGEMRSMMEKEEGEHLEDEKGRRRRQRKQQVEPMIAKASRQFARAEILEHENKLHLRREIDNGVYIETILREKAQLRKSLDAVVGKLASERNWQKKDNASATQSSPLVKQLRAKVLTMQRAIGLIHGKGLDTLARVAEYKMNGELLFLEFVQFVIMF